MKCDGSSSSPRVGRVLAAAPRPQAEVGGGLDVTHVAPGKFTIPPIISVGFPSVLCGKSRRREANLSGVLQTAGLEEGGRRKAHLEAAPLLPPSPQPQPRTQLWSFFQTSAWNVRADTTPLTQGPSPGPSPAQGPLVEAVGPCSVPRD